MTLRVGYRFFESRLAHGADHALAFRPDGRDPLHVYLRAASYFVHAHPDRPTIVVRYVDDLTRPRLMRWPSLRQPVGEAPRRDAQVQCRPGDTKSSRRFASVPASCVDSNASRYFGHGSVEFRGRQGDTSGSVRIRTACAMT